MFTKKTKEAYDNKIALLEHELKDLREIVKTQELIKLRSENEKLKEKVKLINNVKFKLQDVAYLMEENAILVKYQVPSIKIPVGDNGEVTKNEMFFAINKLQLIPFNDMQKIQALINEIKKNNK